MRLTNVLCLPYNTPVCDIVFQALMFVPQLLQEYFGISHRRRNTKGSFGRRMWKNFFFIGNRIFPAIILAPLDDKNGIHKTLSILWNYLEYHPKFQRITNTNIYTVFTNNQNSVCYSSNFQLNQQFRSLYSTKFSYQPSPKWFSILTRPSTLVFCQVCIPLIF